LIQFKLADCRTTNLSSHLLDVLSETATADPVPIALS